jgi:hypothetical protein
MEPKQLWAARSCFAVARYSTSFLICAATLYLTGCASANYRKADAANSSLQKAAMAIDAQNRAIDQSLAALDDLVNQPALDLRPQFNRFSTSVDRLVDASHHAEKTARQANEKSVDYFQDWDKELVSIKYDAVREQSVSRKTQVSNEFNTLNQRYRENQAVVGPLISYLQDIRTALSTDLTAGGIQSVKPLAQNAEQNARKVQTALVRESGDLSASGTGISSRISQATQSNGVGEATEATLQRAQSGP